jgi:HEAT repeat protein
VVQQLDNQDHAVRNYAINALRHMYEPETAPLLIERLQHPSVEQRATIVDLLGELEDKRAVEPLIPLLRDPVPAVQLAALNALVRFRDHKTAEPLMQLLSLPDEKIRERAVFGLGELHVQFAVPALIILLTTAASPRLRWEIVVALGKLGSSEAVPALIDVLQDEDVSISGSAVNALRQIGDVRAIAPLEAFAKVPRPTPLESITQLALDALDKIKAKAEG